MLSMVWATPGGGPPVFVDAHSTPLLKLLFVPPMTVVVRKQIMRDHSKLLGVRM